MVVVVVVVAAAAVGERARVESVSVASGYRQAGPGQTY